MTDYCLLLQFARNQLHIASPWLGVANDRTGRPIVYISTRDYAKSAPTLDSPGRRRAGAE